MISTTEAKSIITENSRQLAPAAVPIDEAAGLVVANDIHAPVSIPAFPQSAMDGYAFAFSGIGKPLLVAGEKAAGDLSKTDLLPGTSIRIFTGAVVPAGADTVVMQEKAKVVDGFLQIEDAALKKGANVRLTGSDITKGALALPAGTKLTAAGIGLLTGMGIDSVEIIPSPRISIIVTGNELQAPGTAPAYGKVYESNSYALAAALKQLHIHSVDIYRPDDVPDTMTKTLREALSKSDLVIMTGGVSVGDYDFTVQVSENCGVSRLFHKVRQKPGKPLFFGKKEQTLFFGLPGNPAAVLTCFYEYVIPALEIRTARKLSADVHHVPMGSAYKKAPGLAHFLKGFFDGSRVHIPGGQESYKLNSFATSNCLVVIPESATEVTEGEKVEIHLLPE